MTTLIQRRIKDGFSILLTAVDAFQLFGEKMNISRIVVVPQEHRRPRLIFNLSENPDLGMLSVNNTTAREVSMELL